MENDVIDSLQDIGYGGSLKDETLFSAAVEEGIKNADFRELVVWTCDELKTLLSLDETVGNVTHAEDISGFVMEVSSLLKELACPYKDLVDGPISERLGKKQQRLLLLEFLLSELMAARMISVDRPNKAPELRIRETSTAKDLKALLLALQFPKPPDNITATALFEKVQAKLKEVLGRAPAELSGKPLLVGRLSEEQWKILSQVHAELQQEYRLRREMLLRRLDVTVQSFQWSERAKGKEDAIAKQYVEKRGDLGAEPNVSLSDIIAARQDLAIIEKTSGSNVRKNTQSSVHKVIIGRVPDRGGRPSEQQAPPPEMPSWKKDRAQGGGGGGGGGFGGGGRGGGGGFGGRGGGGGGGGGQFSRGGGRVQGNWNPKDDRQQDSRKDDRRGDYDRGGHDNRGSDRGGYGHDNRGGGYGNDNRDGQDSRGGYRGGRGGHRGGRGRGRGNY